MGCRSCTSYDPEVYEARKKGERSLPLIEMMVAENPNDPLYKYYLGQAILSSDSLKLLVI